MSPTIGFRTPRCLVGAVLGALLLTVVTVPTTAGATVVPHRTAAHPLPADIEALAAPVGVTSCEPLKRVGVVWLGRLLSSTYAHTGFAETRTCDKPVVAEQYQGRVLSWKVSVRKATQRREASAVIGWLRGRDAQGNPYANARRLGVARIVWNGRVWRSNAAGAGFQPYSSCANRRGRSDDKRCGRSAMLIVLSWSGALGRTSYWTGQVAPEDFGPCRGADLNWAAGYVHAQATPCPRQARVTAPAGSSRAVRELVAWSGIPMRAGLTGPAVKAVQRAVKVPATGRFATSTAHAIRTWQHLHGLPVSGQMTRTSWHAMLKANVPHYSALPVIAPSPSMPTSAPSGWRRIYSEDFLTPAALGSFVPAGKDDWKLAPDQPYADSLRSYPDGWATTHNSSLNYASKTVDVVPQSGGANGVFRLHAYTDTVGGKRRSLAGSFFPVIDPSAQGDAQVAQTYGRYSVRFHTDGGYRPGAKVPRYGSAFLLWPADDVWNKGEIDFPEMAWGNPIAGFVHKIGAPTHTAATVGSEATTDDGWHIATIEWKPTALVFFLDGQVVQTVTHDVPSKPFRWGFQSGGHDGTPPDGVEGHLYVDWITIDAWDGAR